MAFQGRSRWPLLAGAAVLVVAVALLAGGGGETTQARDPEVLEVATAQAQDVPLPRAPGQPTPEEPTPELPTDDVAAGTPEPTPATTVAPSPTPTPTPLVPEAGPISVFIATVEYGSGTPELGIERIDPTTGRTAAADVRFRSRLSPSVLAVLGDGLATIDSGNAVRYSADLERGEVLSSADGLLGAPSGSRVWLLDAEPIGDALAAYSIAASGERGPAVSLPSFARPAGAIEQGLVVQTGPDVVLIRPDGTLATLGPGEAIAVGTDEVGLLRCPAALECRVVVIDGTGAVVADVAAPSELPAPDDRGAGAVLSPDGRRLAFGDVYGAVGLAVLDLTSGEVTKVPTRRGPWPSALAWTPDGSALVTANSAGLPMYWELGSDEPVALAPLEGNTQILDIMILETGQ